MGRESIVDPVYKIGTEVQCRKLHADIQASAGLWRKFRLEDWDGGVDEAHAAAGDDSRNDDMCVRVGGRLQ